MCKYDTKLQLLFAVMLGRWRPSNLHLHLNLNLNLNLNRGITHREDLKVNFNLQPEQTFEADGVLRISTFNTFLDDPGDDGGGKWGG